LLIFSDQLPLRSGAFLRGEILFRVAREDPTKIGETVQIAQDLRINIRGRSHATLSPAAGRSREIESGAGRV